LSKAADKTNPLRISLIINEINKFVDKLRYVEDEVALLIGAT